LASLGTQADRPEQVIVIDNAPASNASEDMIAERYAELASYVREPVAGLDFARNRALQESDCDIVAFIDDDAVAAPTWVQAIRRLFSESDDVAVCTGKVDALFLETEGQRLFEANGGFGKGNKRIVVSPSARRASDAGWRPLIAWSISLGSGCNFAIRKDVALQLGGFDEALDMGAALPGGGDLDMLWRVLEAGHDVIYEPDAQAWHEHRREVSETIRQIIGHNMSLITMLTKAVSSAKGMQRGSVFAFLVWRLMKPGIRLLRRAIGRDPLPARALLSLWAHCWRGLFSYPAARTLAVSRKALISP
jgi:GT2 family glycosyltransferase